MIKVLFGNPESKKHSIRYYEIGEDGVIPDYQTSKIGSIYIKKATLPEGIAPRRIRVTVEVLE